MFFQHQDEVENRNIYITSDEEIGEGDWYYTERFGIGIAKNEGVSKIERTIDSYKKIILTTDPNLIADGVQAIDDEFLEWFVKNPTCEFVDILKDKCLDTSLMCDCVDEPCRNKGYKIIIPQEKPKQETLEEAAEKYAEGKSSSSVFQEAHKKDFIKGAKWQQERSYSEEDLVELLNFVSKEYNISNGIGWFHTHESIEDVSSKEVLDKFFEKRKKK